MEDYDAACAGSRRHLDAIAAHYTPEQALLLLEMFNRVAEAYRSATKELRADAP
jgi:hypothetical protein